jgi:hypothetical protein
MGVALSVTSLVTALVQDNLDQFKGSYVKAANRLKRIVVDNECAEGYYYYKVPCPWIQVKLLKLLQYYPPPGMLAPRIHIQASLTTNQRIHMFVNSFEKLCRRLWTLRSRCLRTCNKTMLRTLCCSKLSTLSYIWTRSRT